MDFDRNLGAYPKEHLQNWRAVSNYISGAVLKKLNLENIQPLSSAGADSCDKPLISGERESKGLEEEKVEDHHEGKEKLTTKEEDKQGEDDPEDLIKELEEEVQKQ